MKRFTSTAVVFAIFFATELSYADVLWDQQPETSLVAAAEQQVPDMPAYSTYLVNDATFGTGVTITGMTTYMTNLNQGLWESVDSAVLNIFDGNGLVNSDDPTSGGDFGPGVVDVTVTDLGNMISITASGLGIELASGTYWFGLTPIAEFDIFDQEFRYDSGSTIGLGSAYRNPIGGLGLPAGTEWGEINPEMVEGYGDAAMTINGSVVPEPTSAGLFVIGSFCIASVRKNRR